MLVPLESTGSLDFENMAGEIRPSPIPARKSASSRRSVAYSEARCECRRITRPSRKKSFVTAIRSDRSIRHEQPQLDRSGERTDFRSSRSEGDDLIAILAYSLIVSRKSHLFSAARRWSIVDARWRSLRRLHRYGRTFGSGWRQRLRRLLAPEPALGQDASD